MTYGEFIHKSTCSIYTGAFCDCAKETFRETMEAIEATNSVKAELEEWKQRALQAEARAEEAEKVARAALWRENDGDRLGFRVEGAAESQEGP